MSCATTRTERRQLKTSEIRSLTWRRRSRASAAPRRTAARVAGGSNGRDDALVNNILKRERLEEAQRLTENRVRRVDRALNQLSERDRCVLQRFYITPCIGGVERLCRELAIEKTTAYRWKDCALRNFTITMYGLTET